LGGVPAWALDVAVTQQLDQLIGSRKASGNTLSKSLRETSARIDALEKRMLPVVFTFNRLGPLVQQRSGELDVLAVWVKDEKNVVNPYDDEAWVENARKETAYVCCDVRRSPRLAQEIQENLAKGLPALSDATSATVATRAKQAAKGSAVVDLEPIKPAVPSGTPAPSGSPAPRGGSAPNTGLSTGVISGLPLPSAPAPAAAPAVPPAAAPGGAAVPGGAPAPVAAPATPAPAVAPPAPAPAP